MNMDYSTTSKLFIFANESGDVGDKHNKMRHIESGFERETRKMLRSRRGDLDSGGDNK